MKILRQFLLILFAFAVAIATSVLTMIYGWGLQPKSWPWIICFSLLGHILAQLIILVAKSKD